MCKTNLFDKVLWVKTNINIEQYNVYHVVIM